MKILLFGCNGQVGWELQRALAPLGALTALGRQDKHGLCGDLSRPDGLRRTIARVAPDVIVNAGAYTAVDRAESEAALAERVNADAPAALAEQSRESGALLVHYSTDYVFNGGGTAPWQEQDQCAPLNVYGATKWAGEQAIRQSGCRHLVFRTSWVYAARGTNFLATMLRLAGEKETLQVVADQTGAPTGAELIADVTAQAIVHTCREPRLGGTYHLAAAGETTWYGYARLIAAAAREMGRPVTVADDDIQPVDSKAFATAARRPHNSRLSCRKLEAAFGLHMPQWECGVRRVIAEMSRTESRHKEHA